MNVTYRTTADDGQLNLVATGEIPFVPPVGMHIRVFDGAELEKVAFVSWSATSPDSLDVWFDDDVAPEDLAMFIQQGWKVETYPANGDAASDQVEGGNAEPVAVPRMAA
ncbi:hypothetical protein [Roseateles sp.]|uniref:hypothetical protein n=1 Tax=Roseateles sp. TaxID=1971397 RepID=UPI0031DFF92F